MIRHGWSWLWVFGAVAACSTTPERSDLRAAAENNAGASDAGAEVDMASMADEVEIVRGVPDRNRDPAVVAVAIGDSALCTGTLISPRLVLTARHCTSRTVEQVACPAAGIQVLGDRDPSTLSIVIGDDVASGHVVARGAKVIASAGATLCDADIAILVLDRPVKVVKPLPVATRGAARGDRVRAVGFGVNDDAAGAVAGIKLVREHVQVLSVGPAEFTVGEATCHGDSGGPALDEDTGAVVGVVSRGGPTCAGPGVHNIYTRTDTFSWLIDEAFANVAGLDRQGDDADADGDGGAPAPAKPAPAQPKGPKQKPPSDMGGPCKNGAQCAAGICVSSGPRAYCSRPCGGGDKCPSRYHCKAVQGMANPGTKVCVEAP